MTNQTFYWIIFNKNGKCEREFEDLRQSKKLGINVNFFNSIEG